MLSRYATAAFFSIALVAAGAAQASIVLNEDGTYQVQRVAGAPRPGSTKSDVLANLGEPRERVAPVGEPAISSWRYDGFQVYFEYDLVLHTVGF